MNLSFSKKIYTLIALIILIILIPIPSYSQNEKRAFGNQELDFYDFEDYLSKLKITSVSKKAELFIDLPNSVYVLTREDIRRSAATRLSEVFSLVPGIIVHNSSYHFPYMNIRDRQWNKPQTTQVLLNGVPIMAMTSGSFVPHVFDMSLDIIDRIEVIKGPGGTLYGSNAVTGIINIYTRKGASAKGLHLSMDGGLQKYFSSFASIGDSFGDNVHVNAHSMYRTTSGYDKPLDRIEYVPASSSTPAYYYQVKEKYPEEDIAGRETISGGATILYNISQNIQSITNMFGMRTSYSNYTFTMSDTSSEFLQKFTSMEYIASERLNVKFTKNHNGFVHGYFRYQNYMDEAGGLLKNKMYIGEMEVQDNFKLFGFNDISIGGNFRNTKFDLTDHPVDNKLVYENPSHSEQLYGGFIQDKISIGKFLDITLGGKAEVWTLVSDKPNYAPSARLSIKPVKGLLFWGGYSKAFTTPGKGQRDLELRLLETKAVPAIAYDPQKKPGTDKVYFVIAPGRGNLEVIKFDYYETGIKTVLIPKVVLDITGYYTVVRDSISGPAQIVPSIDLTFPFDNSPLENYIAQEGYVSPADPTVTAVPAYKYSNSKDQRIWGGEAIIKFFPVKTLKFEVSYSHLDGYQKIKKTGEKITFNEDRMSPKHIYRFRSYVDVPSIYTYLTVNFAYHSHYKIGTREQDASNTADPPDPNEFDNSQERDLYLLDVVLEWRFLNNTLLFNLWGRNLLNMDPYRERSGNYLFDYDHEIHSTFGAGVKYTF